jgi:tRNA(Ile2) C34 agmatinyltransferase TiaS
VNVALVIAVAWLVASLLAIGLMAYFATRPERKGPRCPICDKRISAEAARCPRCGARLRG